MKTAIFNEMFSRFHLEWLFVPDTFSIRIPILKEITNQTD